MDTIEQVFWPPFHVTLYGAAFKGILELQKLKHNSMFLSFSNCSNSIWNKASVGI